VAPAGTLKFVLLGYLKLIVVEKRVGISSLNTTEDGVVVDMKGIKLISKVKESKHSCYRCDYAYRELSGDWHCFHDDIVKPLSERSMSCSAWELHWALKIYD